MQRSCWSLRGFGVSVIVGGLAEMCVFCLMRTIEGQMGIYICLRIPLGRHCAASSWWGLVGGHSRWARNTTVHNVMLLSYHTVTNLFRVVSP
ncbi:hypothetical protein BDV98DRAFT_561427 [Pterulicium gracile]|uniref:Uncharacterized protein n=1 Tax=Pterulicium gracile TaxID=1884261 RepID=A0A5C3QXF9_9AGAR|nr:hypothetical protein BDV98DRAFT_561427 [Pterula gracilis]